MRNVRNVRNPTATIDVETGEKIGDCFVSTVMVALEFHAETDSYFVGIREAKFYAEFAFRALILGVNDNCEKLGGC